jgi:hypothetical protein
VESLRPKQYYWYRVGYAHTYCVRADDEDAARAAVLAANPHARGQRVEITPVLLRGRRVFSTIKTPPAQGHI